MSDFIPKAAPPKMSGLGPKAQRLQALREKNAKQSGEAAKAGASAANTSVKARNSFAGKKTAFQRKAT